MGSSCRGSTRAGHGCACVQVVDPRRRALLEAEELLVDKNARLEESRRTLARMQEHIQVCLPPPRPPPLHTNSRTHACPVIPLPHTPANRTTQTLVLLFGQPAYFEWQMCLGDSLCFASK